MNPNRDVVTPFLAFIFLVVAISGTMMFFHLADDYTEVVHEFLGLGFASFAMLHIISNWKSILSYAKRRKLLVPTLTVMIVAVFFVAAGKVHGNVEREMLKRLVKAPVANCFKALDIDYKEAKETLMKNNILIRDSLQSIEEISQLNHVSPDEIAELIILPGQKK